MSAALGVADQLAIRTALAEVQELLEALDDAPLTVANRQWFSAMIRRATMTLDDAVRLYAHAALSAAGLDGPRLPFPNMPCAATSERPLAAAQNGHFGRYGTDDPTNAPILGDTFE